MQEITTMQPMDWDKIFANNTTAAAAKSLQSCPTFCDPMDCISPSTFVHGIHQAGILD